MRWWIRGRVWLGVGGRKWQFVWQFLYFGVLDELTFRNSYAAESL